MDDRTTSIERAIAAYGQRTGVSAAFLSAVRTLLTSRGIDLDDDVTPYRALLAETFERQAAIDAHAGRGLRRVQQLQDDLQAVRRACDQSRQQLYEVAASARRSLRQLDANERHIRRIRYQIAKFYTPLEP
jgi:hypothetical protein